MADFTRKTFAVTITGTDWNDQPVSVTKTVETHGDGEQAIFVLITQDFPVTIRRIETKTAERIN